MIFHKIFALGVLNFYFYYAKEFSMTKFDLCVKAGSYTDRNGNEKVSWENVGVMMDNGNGPYILIKPWINFAGFPREDGRNHLIVSLFEHKDNEQRNNRQKDDDFQNDNYNEANIPF